MGLSAIMFMCSSMIFYDDIMGSFSLYSRYQTDVRQTVWGFVKTCGIFSVNVCGSMFNGETTVQSRQQLDFRANYFLDKSHIPGKSWGSPAVFGKKKWGGVAPLSVYQPFKETFLLSSLFCCNLIWQWASRCSNIMRNCRVASLRLDCC